MSRSFLLKAKHFKEYNISILEISFQNYYRSPGLLLFLLQNQSRKITKVSIFVIRSPWSLCWVHLVVCQRWHDNAEPMTFQPLPRAAVYVRGVPSVLCQTVCNSALVSTSACTEHQGSQRWELRVFSGLSWACAQPCKFPEMGWSFSKPLMDISFSGLSILRFFL